MDEEYIQSCKNSDNDNQLEFLEDLSEDEICDITEDIFLLIDEHMKNEIINLSSPNFYKSMIEHITDTIFDDWLEFNICKDDQESETYSDLVEYVESLIEIYFEFTDIPKRARAYSNDLETENDFHELSKKIQYLYMQKFNGNETHRFMLNNKNDYFHIFINFILDYHQLLDIINHPDISKILSNVDKLFLEKIKLEEDKYIDLYLRYNNHTIIIKEVKSLKHLGMIKIQHNIDKSWLEKFEEYVIKKNIFIFGHSNNIKQIQKNRLDEKINKYRLYIRYPDLLKKLLYIRDKEQKEYNKHFENDDFYIY